MTCEENKNYFLKKKCPKLKGHWTGITSIFLSIEDFKLNQYRNFQLIFHFIRYLVKSIIFRVSHRLPVLYCVLESTLKKSK